MPTCQSAPFGTIPKGKREIPTLPVDYTGGRKRGKPLSHFTSFVRIPALAIRQHLYPLPKLGVLDEDCLRMRVLPNDIDINLHLNNARYLSQMDYARTHLLARVGLLDHIVRSRWQPLVGAVWVTYRRSLPLLARFQIASRLICWDNRWFYLEQTFTGSEGLCALGWVKGVLRDFNGIVDPQLVIDRVAPGLDSPPMPESFATWNDLTKEKLAAG